MKELIERKRVTIQNKGLIYPLMLTGPVDDPITLTMDKIKELVMASYKVYEVLNDGTKVLLTASNYDKENGDKSNPSTQRSFEVVNFPTGHRIDKTVNTLPPRQTQVTLEQMLRNSTKVLSPNVTTDIRNKDKVKDVSVNKSKLEESYSSSKNKKKLDSFESK